MINNVTFIDIYKFIAYLLFSLHSVYVVVYLLNYWVTKICADQTSYLVRRLSAIFHVVEDQHTLSDIICLKVTRRQLIQRTATRNDVDRLQRILPSGYITSEQQCQNVITVQIVVTMVTLGVYTGRCKNIYFVLGFARKEHLRYPSNHSNDSV